MHLSPHSDTSAQCTWNRLHTSRSTASNGSRGSRDSSRPTCTATTSLQKGAGGGCGWVSGGGERSGRVRRTDRQTDREGPRLESCGAQRGPLTSVAVWQSYNTLCHAPVLCVCFASRHARKNTVRFANTLAKQAALPQHGLCVYVCVSSKTQREHLSDSVSALPLPHLSSSQAGLGGPLVLGFSGSQGSSGNPSGPGWDAQGSKTSNRSL